MPEPKSYGVKKITLGLEVNFTRSERAINNVISYIRKIKFRYEWLWQIYMVVIWGCNDAAIILGNICCL